MTMPGDTSQTACPACSGRGSEVFYTLTGVPVHDVTLIRRRQEALECPTGDIALTFCARCGLIWNRSYDPRLMDYGHAYESTQAYSGTFSGFHRRLASDLIDRYGLRGQTIVEIGCGQGEFLELLCAGGTNRGFGIDPAYRGPAAQGSVTYLSEEYSPAHGALEPDLLVCKMTLEHIAEPAALLTTVGAASAGGTTRVFFQVPDVKRIIQETAFWDVYYEHCNYFGAGSLARLFRRCGLRVTEVWRDYADQYLMIDADTGAGCGEPLPVEDTPGELAAELSRFADRAIDSREAWRRRLADEDAAGGRTALWGGGSKAVAFLTATGAADTISCAVDINPAKAGTFLPGSGVEVVSPDDLIPFPPDKVIAMNPIYRDEIAAALQQRGLSPVLETVVTS